MKCIYCSGSLDVANSRGQSGRNQVWRRRKCRTCGSIFTSHEAIDLSAALTVASGKAATGFERDRLFLSIYNACRHRDSAAADAAALTATAIKQIISSAVDGVIGREHIIKLVANILRRFDSAAAVQYKAFHK